MVQPWWRVTRIIDSADEREVRNIDAASLEAVALKAREGRMSWWKAEITGSKLANFSYPLLSELGPFLLK